jgi:hypothetical protein
MVGTTRLKPVQRGQVRALCAPDSVANPDSGSSAPAFDKPLE